jgi:hypothetical protein
MAGERYRQKVALLNEVLRNGDSAGREAITLLRELIERIDLTPALSGEPPNLERIGNIAVLLGEPRKNRSLVPVVAGAGFEPTTFRL